MVNVNDRLKELGLKPSPSGLAINYYEKIADIDPKLALAGIRIDLELMLKNLSKGFNVSINKNDSIFRMTKILRDGNAITDNQYHLIQKLIRISNAAIHGKDVTRPQANDVFKIMDILIKDFVSWLEWGFTNN